MIKDKIEIVLTGAEKEIINLLMAGKLRLQIPAILSITVGTVDTHLKNIRQKLGVSSIQEIVVYGFKNNLHENKLASVKPRM